MTPCLDCGEVSEGIRCEECSPSSTELRGLSPAERGYDTAWRRLSLRARRLQQYCTDCGTTENLTCDHLPSAWERKARGLPLRLVDVDVVCGPCNLRRGSSRVGSARAALGPGPGPAGRSTGTQGPISDSRMTMQPGA